MTNNAANLAIWNEVEKTDPDYTKEYNSGGMKGTSINASYLAKKATQVFGPMGIGWGVEIVNEEYREGHIIGTEEGSGMPIRKVIHVLRVRLWYKNGDQEGSIFHYGQTTFVGKYSTGIYTDEEAPKKSLTDATTKALSMLGFGGDIFMGMYDDPTYRAEISQDVAEEKAEDREAAAAKRWEDFQNWYTSNADLMRTATSLNEVTKLYGLAVKKIERFQQKSGKNQSELLDETKEIYLERKKELEAKEAGE